MSEEIRLKERKLLHDGTCLRFYTDTMEIPDGSTQEWDMVEHKFDAAAVIPLLPNGNVILVRQLRPAAGRYTWEIPAGKKEDFGKEDSLICARRELKEETGYDSDDVEYLMSIRVAIAYSSEKLDLYIARNVKKVAEQNLDPGEMINIKEWNPDELYEMVLNGKIEDSKTIAAILYLKAN